MPRPGTKLYELQHSVDCPECLAGRGHWCRDSRGQCVPPHRERRRKALMEIMRAYAPLDLKGGAA